jgi:hypothetical protein
VTQDRRTKQQLLEQLAETENERDAGWDEAAEARDHIAQMDAEAKVIASCVDAIAALPGETRRHDTASTYWEASAGVGLPLTGRQERIARILDYLRIRHGLPSHEDLRQRVADLEAELAGARAALEEVADALPRGVSDA